MVDTGIVAQIDYTSRDFTGYRAALFAYAAQVLPEWTSRSPADFGVVMVEIFSYLGDIVSFYQDRIEDEGYLQTATLRSSVVAIAQQLGYQPGDAVPATGQVSFVATSSLLVATVVPAGTQVVTAFNPGLDRPITYETVAPVTVQPGNPLDPPPPVAVGVIEGITQGSRQLTLYPASATAAAVTVSVEDVGTSSGAQSQSFTLAQSPVLLSTVRLFVDDGTAGTEWTQVPDFLLAEPTATVFTASTDDTGVTSVTLGDGINGSIVPTGLKVAVAYRTGGGSYGNLPEYSVQDFATPLTGIQVWSSTAMSGGADAESVDQIRVNAPKAFRAQGRAVGVGDYADLALSQPTVADAHAVGLSAASVTVYVIGPNLVPLTQAQRDALVAYIQPLALAGVTVVVTNATTVPVNFGTSTSMVMLGVLPRYKRSSVLLAVQQAIQNAFAPGVVTFASRISLSHIYQAIQDTPGVDYVQIPVMARYDMAQSGTADIICRDWEIPVVGAITITATGGV